MRFLLLLLLSAASTLLAQSPPAKGGTESPTAGAQDPYTKAVPKAMEAAGVVAYGPFIWANNLRTEDVDRVLGENRIRWIETAHFLIGSTLEATNAPGEPEARQLMNADLARMRKRHVKFPARASKMDAWLRLHLYAHRAEALYAEYAELVGHPADAPTHLGMKNKFPLLLMQKRSDVARYLDRFCGSKGQGTQRCQYPLTDQSGFVLSAEGQDPFDEATVHAHFRYQLIQTFCDATDGAPYWLRIGLAHWYERQVPCNVMLANIKDDEHVDQATQNKWDERIRKRAEHEQLLIPFHEIAVKYDLGYWDHVQAWSRVDFLMATNRKGFGAFLAALRAPSITAQIEQLDRTLGLTPETFDATWRQWLLKGK